MVRNKIVNKEELLKLQEEIIDPLKEHLVDIVIDVLRGTQENLAQEMSGVGLFVMRTVMDLEIAAVSGKKGKHRKEQEYGWWGVNPGSVVLNGVRVKCEIPRARHRVTKKCYPLQTYSLFHQAAGMMKRAFIDLICGVSTRRYKDGVEQFLNGYGVSASTVSRHIVEATAGELETLMNRSLHGMDFPVLMIDGIVIHKESVIVALGITNEGVKRVLGIWQGSTENAAIARALLNNLVDRGLSAEQPRLVVIDGGKGLHRAVVDVFGEASPIQRCTYHKQQNVLNHLPGQYHGTIRQRMKTAYTMLEYHDAKRELLSVVNDLEKINPSAANSLNEGLEETLTLHKLGIGGTLRRSLKTTNIIESLNSVIREKVSRVKHWQNGDHRQRWVAAAALDAEKHFRCINGCDDLKTLVEKLDDHWKAKKLVA
jgi:putative transposase